MHRLWLTARQCAPGIALCLALSFAGDRVAAATGMRVPGAMIGLVAYALCLGWGRGIGWSRPGAALLARWIGALLAPVLVGLVAHRALLTGMLVPLALVLVATTLATALVTASVFLLVSRRR